MEASKNNTFAFVFMLVFCAFFNTTLAQQITDNQLKAGYIYNFLKNLNWENENNIDTFKIGVYGDDLGLINVLQSIEKLKVKNKPIKVETLKSSTNIPYTHILLVTIDKNFLIKDIFESITSRNTLLISDLCKYQNYVMINFVYNENSKIQFEINSQNLESAHLKSSPKLILLGGSEIDVRKLYVETEKSLANTKILAQHYEKELESKKMELARMDSSLRHLNIDIIAFQNKILSQKSELNKLSKQTTQQEDELNQKSQVLSKQQIEIFRRERQLNSKDREISAKQRKIEEFGTVLNKQQNEINNRQVVINRQEKTMVTQVERIRIQQKMLYLLIALIGMAIALIILVYRSFTFNKRKNFQLQKVNNALNESKNEISEQAHQLELKNVELEKLSIVASKTDNAVIIMNAGAEFEWVNEGFYRLYGYTLSQFIDSKGSSLPETSSYEFIDDILTKVRNEKVSATYESPSVNKEGKRVWIHSTLTPILDQNNEILKLIIIDSDITSLKEAELNIIEKNEEIQRQSEELFETTEQLMALNQELETKRSKLEEALEKLKGTQSQLVESEKMVVLGQLTAGIAHEINNPVNYINSGVDGITIAFEQILEIISEYEKLTPDNFKDQTEEIIKLKKQVGYPEIIADIRQLNLDIKSGVHRTIEIVKGLRTFSRLDESDLKLVDLHQSIDSTLVLLRNKYINKIEIIRNFGNIPKIECFPGKINQVILNILVNAIQAIKESGEIEIITRPVLRDNNENVHISIKDNGCGMSPETKKRIFEPFFTTKEIGEGTGLGLSISYNIIESHFGHIEVESKIGKGTTFHIYLPLEHNIKSKHSTFA